MTALIVVACVLAGWLIVSLALAPLIGACVACRPMTHEERESLAWGGLGLFMAVFLVVLILIGAHQ